MNKGSFAKNCELLLIHLHNLEFGKLGNCIATTKFLAKSLKKSERQIYRYLKILQETKLIKINTSKLKRNSFSKKPYKLRKIHTICTKPKDSKEILSIHFDKNINEEQKYNLIKLILKNKELNYAKIIENRKEINKKITKIFNREYPDKMLEEEKQRIMKICQEDEQNLKKKHSEKEFYKKLESQAKSILDNLNDNLFELHGDTYIEKLAHWSTESHRRMEETMDEVDPPSTEQKIAKFKLFVSNCSIEKNEYIITIYLGGQIPYRIRFLDYVPWDKNSENFKLFEKIFKETKEI